ncbi:MAG: metallophosphoesterase [Bryobacteraceae bacterium]
MLTRRCFLGAAPLAAAQPATQRLRLWTFSDAHVGTDMRFGRESLATALRQSERDFEWDLALDLGDMSGGQSTPEDSEGEQIVRQFAAMRNHAREQVYSLCGNHDRSGLGEPPNHWWRKWVDPTGEHSRFSRVDPANRPHAIEGTWERYSFQVGNLLFLMMSDINEPTQKIGRGPLGGNPGGVVSGETFAWWKKMVEANQDKIIVSAHHYLLKNTTVATGDWEGMRRDANGRWVSHYHGYKEQGTPIGASYLYWVDSRPGGQAFERYLADHPGAIDIWLGGHTHTNPDDTYGGKSHIERKWGVWFVNVSPLTRYHVRSTSIPMSRVWTIEGDRALVRCYLHTADHAPQGWYGMAERRLQMAKTFRLDR